MNSKDTERAFALYNSLNPPNRYGPAFVLVVDGDPPSKARPRFVGKAGRKRAYTPQRQKDHEVYLGWRFRQKLTEPLKGNLAVACIFFRRTLQRVDVDNMVKHVLDSGTHICWEDDSQITGLSVVLEYDPSNPRTIVAVGPHVSTLRRDGAMVAGNCEKCGKGFSHPHWRKNRQRFCSSACIAKSRGQDLSELVPCRQCGLEFKRITATSVLCSSACRKIWFLGRKRPIKRTPQFCVDCGKPLIYRGTKRCRSCWKVARKAYVA